MKDRWGMEHGDRTRREKLIKLGIINGDGNTYRHVDV